MDLIYTKLKRKKEWRIVEALILEDKMKQPPKKTPQEVTLPTFQVPWAIPSTIGGPRWEPHMYGMGPTMYLTMIGFQLPLRQTIALPSKHNKEATTMNVNFSRIGPSSKKKRDS
jgi:hypothetical protein